MGFKPATYLLQGVCALRLPRDTFLDSFLVVIATCHYPVLDEFGHHFEAFVHFPLTNSINESQQHRNKFFGMPRIKPGAAG